ncbi:FAD/NAD-binding domain-containing protein [Phellopilus nigrolimitatus]|nr:FAD/NAD-binding domain-containing protein [Phellopilus nigrolimitatus]
MKNLEFTIYDKNAGVGGTWFSNRYPGVACDLPSHCYQTTFEENTQWSSFYAPGSEIRAEIERIVDKYKLMRYIKLEHELVHARYDEGSGKWHLRLRRRVPGSAPADEQYEVIEDTADFVLSGVGSLSRWRWPDIEGLRAFKGKLVHSAAWELDEAGSWQGSVADWKDKRVGVIGVGSSSIQIVPTIQPLVKHLYHYVRGQTWLAPPFQSDFLSEFMNRDPAAGNYIFTEADRQAFKDPAFYKKFRHSLEAEANSIHFITIKGTESQKAAQEAFKTHMRTRLAKEPWITDRLMPDFSVTCKRLTPGPGFLEALCEDNVDFVPTHIKRITETGIELVDGTHHDLDVIVCATGYDTTFQYPFTVVGRGGKTLLERYKPHPETYLSLCSDGFPNWFMSFGPNSVFGTGTLIIVMERQIDYAVEAAKKLQREHLKSIEPKKEAVADFDEYLEHYFRTTVFNEPCRSWYKAGKADGRIIGLWPGSSLHAMRTLKHPRWEDYNFEPLDGIQNRFHWLGDGSTHNEKHMTGDRAWYLNPEEVDIPPVPEEK